MDVPSENPPPAPNVPPRPAPAAPARPSFWLYALPVASLVVTLGLWYQTRSDLARLIDAQRQLAADLDEARGLSSFSVAGAPAKGAADQVVTLVEFSDYECPFCIRHFTQTMPAIEERYIKTGQVRYVFKDFPIAQLHPAAIGAHEAARCANEQGKFWEMHNRMFSPAGTHDASSLTAKAKEIGLDMASYGACLSSDRTLADVKRTTQMAFDLGASGTPAFFVGIRDLATDDIRVVSAISGAQPIEAFEKAFEAARARVR